MARFADVVGFGHSTQDRPGHFTDVITEKKYFGDVIRGARQTETVDKVNDDLVADATISIVADGYISDNVFAIRYVKWAGSKWKVVNVTPNGARLLLRLGGVYNRPTPTVSN